LSQPSEPLEFVPNPGRITVSKFLYPRTSKEYRSQENISIEQQIESTRTMLEKAGYRILLAHVFIDRDLSGKYPSRQFREGKGKYRAADLDSELSNYGLDGQQNRRRDSSVIEPAVRRAWYLRSSLRAR
jgi:hypothetical protein